MSSGGSEQTGPVPSIVIEPPRTWFRLDLGLLWEYRDLLYFLVWRDLKARYAQTLLGLAWAVIQPLTMMVVFTVIFSEFAKFPSQGVPYPVFVYCALVPWTYFSKSFDRSGFSVVAESNLIKKIYFPRLIIPLAATLGGLLDFAISFCLLILMMLWYGMTPTWGIMAVPILLLMIIATSLAVSLWLSALYVRYRDVAAAIPLLIQVWLFASPVVYPITSVPPQWRPLYDLNPMVGVIEGFRWALLGNAVPDLGPMAIGGLVVVVFLIGAIGYFNRVERSFADII